MIDEPTPKFRNQDIQCPIILDTQLVPEFRSWFINCNIIVRRRRNVIYFSNDTAGVVLESQTDQLSGDL